MKDIVTADTLLVVEGCLVVLPVLLALAQIARPKSLLRRCARGGSLLLFAAAVVVAALLGIVDPPEGWARYGKAGDWAPFIVGLPWSFPLVYLLRLAEEFGDLGVGSTLLYWVSWGTAALNAGIMVQFARANAAQEPPRPES